MNWEPERTVVYDVTLKPNATWEHTLGHAAMIEWRETEGGALVVRFLVQRWYASAFEQELNCEPDVVEYARVDDDR